MRSLVPWAVFGVATAASAATLISDSLVGRSQGGGFRALIVVILVFSAIGALVAWRRPGNAIGWVMLALGLCGALLGLGDAAGILAHERPDLSALQSKLLRDWVFKLLENLWVPMFALIGVLVLLFPTGRPPTPRWAWYLWLTTFLIVVGLLTSGPSAGSLGQGEAVAGFPLLRTVFPADTTALLTEVGQSVVGIGLILLAVVAAASLIVRFRRSSGVVRQQLKWFAFAASIFAAVYVGTSISFFIPEIRALDPDVHIPVAMFGGVPFLIAMALLPLSVGIAILRYRLFDIDVLINRTLVYGALSATLVTSYVVSVLALQTILRPLTTGSDVAVAASTLAVVALFQPLRRRIQSAVDRRFYRSRYDASRAVEQFAARLRDKVDLESVRADLIGVVSETVRPAHASVWLRRVSR